MTCPFATYPNRLGLNLKHIVNSSPDNFRGTSMKEKSIKRPLVGLSQRDQWIFPASQTPLNRNQDLFKCFHGSRQRLSQPRKKKQQNTTCIYIC